MAENCLKCLEPIDRKGRSKYGTICRPCVAEMMLAGEEIQAFLMAAAPHSREGLQRYTSCERCGTDTSYTSELPHGGVWCDDCGLNCCRECARRVVVEFPTEGGETIQANADRFLCKVCVAGRILGNWKVKYVVKGADGQETLQEMRP